MLAAKASIAVRCDNFGGDVWSKEMVDDIAEKVEKIRKENPRPNSR